MRLYKISTHAALAALLLAAAGLTACDDFLEVQPKDRLLNETFYQTTDECESAVQALYTKPWFEFNDKFYFAMGDGRGGNLLAPWSDYIYPFADFNETGLTGPLVKAWSALYIVFSQSTRVAVAIGESALDEATRQRYQAEARFMRGVAAYYIASLWGNAVLFDDPTALVDNPLKAPSPRKDVYEYAMRDMEFAAMHLPASTSAGRVNKYSAYGMLSRFYLAYAFFSANPETGDGHDSNLADQAYLDKAKKAAKKVIDESDFELLDDYEAIFEIDGNNNKEQMFCLQWVPGVTTWGITNSQQAYLAYGSAITGDDAAWGGATYAYPECALEFLDNGEGVRRHATWMAKGDKYPNIDKAHGGLTVDNGVERLNGKKGVVGSAKDNAATARMNSGLNTNMLRLAEVYLNYAEACLGTQPSCNDALALEYINKVRKRAKMNPIEGNFTWDQLRHENRMEFCLEGKYWYDLARRAMYQQQNVLNIISAQHRETTQAYKWDPDKQTYTPNTSGGSSKRAIGALDSHIFLLPYPETELIQNPMLNGEPEPYPFAEERISEDKLFE